jgi:predicted dehydrogenase
MIRFGLVGTNTSHAEVFANIFNGGAAQAPALDGGKVVAVWGDPSAEAQALEAARSLPDASALADGHQIDAVVADPSEMIGQIDAVLVVDDTGLGAAHGRLARPFIAAGIPTFIDKPMTLDLAEASSLFDLAEQRGVPIMSSSALRYAREVAELRERADAIGTLSSVVSVGPGDWYNYGVHAVEMMQTVVGPGACGVHRFATPQHDIAVVDYDNGPAVVIETLRDAAYVFHLVAYGAKGWGECEVADAAAFYTRLMAAVLEMVRTRRAPISRAETLEILGILHAGERSAQTGQRVRLVDVMART